MLKRILVPLDGSPFAEDALSAAVAVARATDGELRLVSVVESPVLSIPGAGSGLERGRRQEYLSGVAGTVEGLRSGSPGVCVREGAVVEQLEAEVNAWAADLVVMSTHGLGGLSRVWLGSVADRCVRIGMCPVLLLRPAEGKVSDKGLRLDRVVLPLDGSPLAERALPYAATLARAFAVPALVLRVVTQPTSVEFLHHSAAMELVEGVRAQDQADAEDYVDSKVAELRDRGISACSAVVNDAEPAQAIIDRASGDLVVLGTHGSGLLSRALFGSVADKVVRGGSQPVLVIPVKRESAGAGD